MKNDKKEKSLKQDSEKVKTPVPPQVMDPSQPPEQGRESNKYSEKNRGFQQKENEATDQQKLAPREEL